MVFNPKEMDQLQFNREYRDALNENFKGLQKELEELIQMNQTMAARLNSVLVNPTGGGNPEVVAARMSRDGEEYPSLFAHLTEIEKDIVDNTLNLQGLMAYADKVKKRINIDEPVDKYYYVDKNWGYDGNDGLSTLAPFKTIQKALDMIPQSTTGGEINIFVADGVYAEDLVLRSKQGSDIKIIGNLDVPTNVKINSFFAVNVQAYLNISGFEATTTVKNGFHYDRCSYVNTNNCISVKDKKASGMSGIYYSAGLGVVAGCTVSNSYNGIIANFSSKVTIEANNTGTGNLYGVVSARSTIHKYNNNTVTGTTKNEHFYAGGEITSGGIS
ncbi:hypothetical protein SB775_06960 [Peribacillus sp. SIMBA_075]|uniref:hypothetical protein n=1 Tax=Peribacillus sp. SIMBA_075 TaxID=3085813 RepID=UPI00397AFA48